MKKLYVLLLVVGFVAIAEDHGNKEGGTDKTRTEAGAVTDKSQRLFQFISACMPGAPTAVADQGTPLPRVPDGGGSGGASVDGSAAFNSRCVTCHTTNGIALTGKNQKAIEKINDGSMPKGGSLTPDEKAAIIKFLGG